MNDMLKWSEEVHEKINRQILPEATDEQVGFIVSNYPQMSPFYYPHWRNGLRESFETSSDEEIDTVYEKVARAATNITNPLEMVVAAEIDIFGRDEDVDLLDYYITKYVRTHMHAMEMWEAKIVLERQMFEYTLKEWVGLFLSDKSVAEHYFQIISHMLSSYSIMESNSNDSYFLKIINPPLV